jgi:hypothetical protein
MFFGAFENGRYNLGFNGMPMNPMRDSVPTLIEARAHFEEGIGKYHFLDPNRSCDCEEYGLTRMWSLRELNSVRSARPSDLGEHVVCTEDLLGHRGPSARTRRGGPVCGGIGQSGRF